MKAKIDFKFNKKIGIIEKIIFDLVLFDIYDIKYISNLLYLFSPISVAKAYSNLVNLQIVKIDKEKKLIRFSEIFLYFINNVNSDIHEIDYSIDNNTILDTNNLSNKTDKKNILLLKRDLVRVIFNGMPVEKEIIYLYSNVMDFIVKKV